MRMRFLAFILLASPVAFGQSSLPQAITPGAPLPSHSGNLIVVTPQAPGFSVQPNPGRRAPLLAQNRPFAFAVPAPQSPTAKAEPIPTQWPAVKFEGIPTRWANLRVVPIGGTGAAPARK
jgi:hypothetical protein